MICAVIEANSFEQEIISKTLAFHDGMEARCFESFSEAVSFLEQNFVDMVFLRISGKEDYWEGQFEMIRAIDREIKIVLIGDNRIEAVKAFTLEATDFLLEPISKNRLEISTRRAIAS